MLNAVTIAAIVAACWAHPSGIAYLAKIDQIEACATVNPCCANVSGGAYRTLADQLWAESVEQARRQAQQAIEQATTKAIPQQIEPAYAVGYWPESNLAQHIFQAKLDALRAAQPIVAAQIAQTMQEDEDEAIIALMMFMD